MEAGAGGVDGYATFVAWGGFAAGDLAVMCLEETVGIFVETCVIEVKFSEAADFIDDVVDDVEFEGVFAGRVVGV